MEYATGHSIPQTDPPRPPRETLPTMYDLPSEFPEEPGLPDEFHDLQPQLLSRSLSLAGYSRDDWFTGSDLNLYYDVHHPLWHKRPDWFLALDVPRLYENRDLRRSYVVWQEGRSPTIVVEFLSPRTEREELGRFYEVQDLVTTGEAEQVNESDSVDEGVDEAMNASSPPSKLKVYEQYLRVPHYLVYSRYTQRLRYFKLVGVQYEEQPLRAEPPLVWLDDLDVGLGIWEGEFEGIPGYWLRWCNAAGRWLSTDTEQAEQRADTERLEKEQAQQRAAQLAERLRALGVDPDDL
ncbi:MAG: Uma2 family endonuclease [Leptolyngbya sp. SIOISBB]|nr:Uma2 family endonuclease [Leptolyngbya sp. SIOISBB]